MITYGIRNESVPAGRAVLASPPGVIVVRTRPWLAHGAGVVLVLLTAAWCLLPHSSS